MNLYKCQRCNADLAIEDGLLCSPCFVKEHSKPITKQNPSHEEMLTWLNDPTVISFWESVQKEIVFQKAQWADVDKTKSSAHWFWVIAHLCSKALNAPTPEKRKHHIVTAASCLYLWLESL